MSTRMFARRMGQISVGSGDQIFCGISLPSGSTINNVRLNVSVHSESAGITMIRAAPYAVEGWILPVLDVDLADTYDDIFDALVPKDTDVQTMDLDTAALDTSPFYEPGEANWAELFDVGLQPELVYRRTRLLTATNGGALILFQDSETPFSPLWIPGESFKIKLSKRYRINQPSVLVFGFAAPAMDDTITTVQAALAEEEWAQVKYVRHVLERAVLHVLGVVEAGAETPWEEATALLQKHLDPDVFEETSGAFAPTTYTVFCDGIIDHSVEGELGNNAVSLGR